jgi:hypothetical protein
MRYIKEDLKKNGWALRHGSSVRETPGDSFRGYTDVTSLFQYLVLSEAKGISVSPTTRMRRGHIIQLQHRMSQDVLEGFGFAMSLIVDHTLLKIYGATSVSVLGIDTLAANRYEASSGERR